MKKIVSILILLFIIIIVDNGFADKIAPNREHTVFSQNKQFLITLTPSEPYEDKGSGKAYRVEKKGTVFLWNVDWFARRVFLSNNGTNLVRMGPWASKRDLSDLAVAFYENGRLLKEYRVADLIQDPASVQRTASHYFWQDRDRLTPLGLSSGDREFKVRTIEGVTYTFDVATGEILSK